MRSYEVLGARRLRRLTSLGATAALVAGGALVVGTATPVQAATTVVVHETDIHPFPLPYEGWHEESGNPRSFGVNDDGLVLVGQSQVINGYDSNLPPLNTRNVSLTKSFVNAVSVDTVEGQAYLQIPMYFTGPGTPLPQFTTLYAANPVDGPIDYDTTLFHNSRAVGSIPELSMLPLAEFMKQIDDYKVRGFGVASGGEPEQSATVASITWDDTTYDFAPAAEAAVQVKGSDIDPQREPDRHLPGLAPGQRECSRGGRTRPQRAGSAAERHVAGHLRLCQRGPGC